MSLVGCYWSHNLFRVSFRSPWYPGGVAAACNLSRGTETRTWCLWVWRCPHVEGLPTPNPESPTGIRSEGLGYERVLKRKVQREAGNRAAHSPALGSGGNTGLSVGQAVTVPGMVPCTFFSFFWDLHRVDDVHSFIKSRVSTSLILLVVMVVLFVMLVRIYDENIDKNRVFSWFVMVIGSACLLIS